MIEIITVVVKKNSLIVKSTNNTKLLIYKYLNELKMDIKKSPVLTIFLFALICTIKAQAGYTKKYFDKDWKPTTKENATYYRLAKYNKNGKPIGLVKDYYVSTETLQGQSHLLFENPDVLDGELVTYFENGSLQSKAYYKKGVPIGTTYIYELPKFYLYTQKSYLSRTIVHNSNSQPEKVYSFSEFNQRDTTGVCYLKDNLLHGPYWSRNESKLELGTYNNGKRTGKRTIYNLISTELQKYDTIISLEENYIDDKLDGVQSMYAYNEKMKELRLYYRNNYINGLLNGESVLYYPWFETPDKNQVRDSAFYKYGKLIGAKYVYKRNGDLDCKHIIVEDVDYCLRGDSIHSFSVKPDYKGDKLVLLSTIEENGNKYLFKTLNRSYLSKISTLILPSSVRKIPSNAFEDGVNLQTISLSDSIEEIDLYALKDTKIRKIIIPASVKVLNNAFHFSDQYVQFEIDKSNKYLCLENGILFNKDRTKLISYSPKNKNRSYIIPSSVLRIEAAAFLDSEYLMEVVTNKKLETIGTHAFSRSKFLTAITLNKNLKYIGDYAFLDCANLTDVEIPKSVSGIGRGAFFSCLKLEKIIIPVKTRSIDPAAFQGCTSLAKIEVDPRNPYFYSKDGVLYKKGEDSQPWCDPTGKVKK